MSRFTVASNADLYDGWWLVIRTSDRRIVFGSRSAFEACRWLRTWGDSLGQSERGKELDRRFAFLSRM